MNTSNKLFSLENKNILITGSAGLLGKMHAEAVMAFGGNVILTDIDNEKVKNLSYELNQKYINQSVYYQMDITSEQSVLNVFNELIEKGIFVDTLINNAACNPAVSEVGMKSNNRLENLDFALWTKDLDVGLRGSVICSKIFGTEMSKRNFGNIINISSDLGIIAPDQRLYYKEDLPDDQQDVKPVSYSIIKHGIIGLTKYLATYWADKGVRANSISPGGVFNNQNALFLSKISKKIPLGRMANANEYQGAIIFLCSDASSYMNGANLVIDGGRSIW